MQTEQQEHPNKMIGGLYFNLKSRHTRYTLKQVIYNRLILAVPENKLIDTLEITLSWDLTNNFNLS